MKTINEVLQELLEIYDNWTILYNSTEYSLKHSDLNMPIFYVFTHSKEEDYFYIEMTYYVDKNQYIAIHSGIKYDDNNSESGGFADSAILALEQLQSAICERANKYLDLADIMEQDKK
jgi:hypothetical protein